MGEGLAVEQLHYADELRSFDEVPLGEGEVKEEELKLAVQLVRQAASNEFRPERFTDDVRARMLAQIQRKVEGEEITAAPAEEPQTQIIDLMEALKASLAKGGDAEAGRKPARRAGAQSTRKTAAKRRKAGGQA